MPLSSPLNTVKEVRGAMRDPIFCVYELDAKTRYIHAYVLENAYLHSLLNRQLNAVASPKRAQDLCE